MEIIKQSNKVTKIIGALKTKEKSIGFVPTMGALHKGHLSLVKKSINNNDITIVSIFINPTQFDNKNDLINYPRTQEEDIQLLNELNCNFVFTPSEEEMYPEPDKRVFDLGNLDKVMEGKYREGHFNGVAKVVSKLFDIVNPNRAYFGEKDFQQLVIIKELVKQHNLSIEIVPCEIVREEDGLAYSSRNKRLSIEERKNVSIIPKTLFKAKSLINQLTVDDLKKWVVDQINMNPLLEVEYFEIVDDEKLQPIKEWGENKNKIGCIAVKTSTVRLIDNIKFYL